MKHLVRTFLFNVFALWLTSQIIPALVTPGRWQIILFAGFILSLLMLIVVPILKILFIPINILTFGLLSWLINVFVLYLLTVFVPEIQITPWVFAGFTWLGFVIPTINFTYIPALIITTLCLSIITNILHTVSDD